MKPRPRKTPLLSSGSRCLFLQRAGAIFVPVLTPKAALLIPPMGGKISRVNRLAFLYTHSKVRHLIINMFEMASSFPPRNLFYAPLPTKSLPSQRIAPPLSSGQETQNHADVPLAPVIQSVNKSYRLRSKITPSLSSSFRSTSV